MEAPISPPDYDHHERCPQGESEDPEIHMEGCPLINHATSAGGGECTCDCTCYEEEQADYADAGDQLYDRMRDEGF